jgi:hypothetical protein
MLAVELLFGASAAQAELFRTFWRLAPEQVETSRTVDYGAPFLRQKLVPLRAAVLGDSVTPKPGGRVYEKGTPLYILFSKDGRSAWCTIKDRSLKNQAKTLFIPLLDERPCFRDRDGDGRFDAVFYVSDALTGPPAQGGDMDAITPIEPVAFHEVDAKDYPEAMIIYFRLLKGRTLERTRLEIMFENAGSSALWKQVWGADVGGAYAIDGPNMRVVVRSVVDNGAQIEFQRNGMDCIRRVRGGLLGVPCPAL